MFFFWRTWEVGSTQCLLVASWVGGEPLLLGKTSLGPTEPSLSLDQLTHALGPVSYLWRESLWLFWPLVSSSYRAYNLAGLKWKNLFFPFYFSPSFFSHFLSSCQGKLVQTNTIRKARDGGQFSWTLHTQVYSCSKALSNTYWSMDSCESFVKRKHGSKTPSMWCQVEFKIYVQGASHH